LNRRQFFFTRQHPRGLGRHPQRILRMSDFFQGRGGMINPTQPSHPKKRYPAGV
jgi:hypothetical protein